MSEKKDIPTTYIIPYNFIDEPPAILGVRFWCFVQGTLLAIVPLIIIIASKLPFATTMPLIGFICIPLFLFGSVGIGDKTVFEFIKILIQYNKCKTVYYYNPRVKKELSSFNAEDTQIELMPRDRIMALLAKYSKKQGLADGNEKETDTSIDTAILYFEEDRDVIKMPDIYKSKADIKKEQQRKNERSKINNRNKKETATTKRPSKPLDGKVKSKAQDSVASIKTQHRAVEPSQKPVDNTAKASNATNEGKDLAALIAAAANNTKEG